MAGPSQGSPCAVSLATLAPACAAAIATCRAWYHMANWPTSRMLKITSGASSTSSMELAPLSRGSRAGPTRSGVPAGRFPAGGRAGWPRPVMSGTGLDVIGRGGDLGPDDDEDRQRDEGEQAGDDRPLDGRGAAIAAPDGGQARAEQHPEIFREGFVERVHVCALPFGAGPRPGA